jgi:hypothetical protein
LELTNKNTMNRLSDNDKHWWKFTFAKWKNRICFEVSSGDDEDPENYIMACIFGQVIRLQIPNILKPTGKYSEHRRQYGFSLTRENGESYNFLSIDYGPQTHDSSTNKTWCYFLPWTEKRMVRHAIYNPDGSHFFTEEKRKWDEYYKKKQECPSVKFEFQDYDGKIITATCIIEEREWHHGSGWFKWLKYFNKPIIRRTLDLAFSSEVGPEKGSWKGGTVGHSTEMLPGDTPEMAFRRYCEMEHNHRRKNYQLKFLCLLPSTPVQSDTP